MVYLDMPDDKIRLLLNDKMYFIFVFLCGITIVMCGPMPQQQLNDVQTQRQNEQTQILDNFSNRLVGNSRIRNNYLNCFLDNGPCSPDANNLKQMVPEAIQRECAHCTELQRRVIEKMMCYLNNHQPDILKQVAAKFDPNGEYMKQYINTIERNENDQFFNPQLNQQQPQYNPYQPQLNQQQPQLNQQQPQLNQQQPQLNQQQPQQNQRQPQQNQRQPQQNQQQPQLQQNQPQPQQNQQELPKTSIISTAPISTVARRP